MAFLLPLSLLGIDFSPTPTHTLTDAHTHTHTHTLVRIFKSSHLFLEKLVTFRKMFQQSEGVRGPADALYLCNFRVSVDGDWLCLKELEEQKLNAAAAANPDIETMVRYPDYPLGTLGLL